MVEIKPDAVVMNDLDTHGKDLVLPASAWRPAGARAFLRSTVTGTRVIKSSNKLSGGAKAGLQVLLEVDRLLFGREFD